MDQRRPTRGPDSALANKQLGQAQAHAVRTGKQQEND